MGSTDAAKIQKSSYTRSLVAGGIAGTTVDLSLYPIDTIKTRLQSSRGFVASGGFRGIYSGVGSAIIGSAPGAALFFVSYEGCKQAFKDQRQSYYDSNPPIPSLWREPTEHMIAASLGEVAACTIRVPTEVIKQRAQAKQYPSSLTALSSILAKFPSRGFIGTWLELYRGWSVTIFREIPFTVIQFPLWEALKHWRLRSSNQSQVSALDSALFGSLSGAVAAAATTPLDVLKTRVMLAKESQSLVTAARSIVQESGTRALFAGIIPRVSWISIGGAVFLGSYQWTINHLT